MNSRELSGRLAALDLIEAVLRRRQMLDDALDTTASYGALPPRDKAFARNLVSTTLRRRGQIDLLISQCLDKPLAKKSRRSHDILRLGICQIFFLETPDHAAVSSSVDLAGQTGQAHTKKMINAVLRRLTREGRDMLSDQDETRDNVPDWLWYPWKKTFGEETARALAGAHLTEAPLDLSVKSDPGDWARKLEGTVLENGSVRLNKVRHVPSLDGFAEGHWWVQDTAARSAVQLLGDVQGLDIIDLCAAPGGKTAWLLNAGARVTAVDRSEKRLARLQENLDRLGYATPVVTADATVWQPEKPVDAVLLDAPCSATGTLRKHPEISWLKSQDDVDKLAVLQSRLLESALRMVKPGGRVLFATCSLQREEGPDQIARVLDTYPSVTALKTLQCLPSDLPSQGGQDGFYASLLEVSGPL